MYLIKIEFKNNERMEIDGSEKNKNKLKLLLLPELKLNLEEEDKLKDNNLSGLSNFFYEENPSVVWSILMTPDRTLSSQIYSC